MMLGFPPPQRGTAYQPRAKLWERVTPSPRVLKERRRCHRATTSNAPLRTCQSRSKLVQARYRNRAAVLGFQGTEVVEGVDAFAKVIGDFAEANFQSLDDRLAGLSQ